MSDDFSSTSPKELATFKDYLRIARLDHMVKHVFIFPGMVLAFLLRGNASVEIGMGLVQTVLLGLLSAVFVASANYVINEWLDRDFDRFHPEKSQRAAVQREMSGKIVLIEYLVLLFLGLALALTVNSVFFGAAVMLGLSGLTYNVKPFRTKDRVFLDVLSESINNPIRLLMGWAMIDGTSLPPVSLVLAFWFGGAFLMNSKRLAEFRDISLSDGVELLGLYRRSFRFYTEPRLSVANLVYALTCSFFMAIFLIKYRVEYILVFPCIVGLFSIYYSLALTPESVARKPEKLYRAKGLIALVAITVVVFIFATYVDIPWLNDLAEQKFIVIDSDAISPQE